MSSNNISPKLSSDSLLPQRDLLLDVDEVARRLSTRLGVDGSLAIDSCERIRAKYRIGHSLRVVHRIQVGGDIYTVAARTFPENRSRQAYERAVNAAISCAPLRPMIHDAEIETVFWTFPNDRKIAGLQALIDVPAQLAQLVPTWTRSQVVAYAPEKCATARCLNDASRVLAYAKIYAGDEGRRIFDIYNALRQSLSPDTSGVNLPRALGYAKDYRMLFLESVKGRRIADLRGKNLVSGYRRLGMALAALHSTPLPAALPPFKRLDVGRFEHAARILSLARPEVLKEAFGLVGELVLSREATGEPPVCLHGDVHPKNGILRGDCLTLIDLDQAGAGHPAADMGSLLASLTYNRVAGLLSKAAARKLGDAFLAGYAEVRQLPEDASLRWHTAAALLAERALRAVNRIRPEGLSCLHELLIEARNILQTGGRG